MPSSSRSSRSDQTPYCVMCRHPKRLTLVSGLQEFDRPNSAYLLVYERRQPYEDVHMAAPQVDESVPIDPMEAPVVAMVGRCLLCPPGTCAGDPSGNWEALFEALPCCVQADSSGTEGDLSNKEGAMLSDSTELSANPKRVRLDLPGIGPLSIQSSIYRVRSPALHLRTAAAAPPSLPHRLPTPQDVTLDNLRMIDEMHRLEKDYMYFIRHLVGNLLS